MASRPCASDRRIPSGWRMARRSITECTRSPHIDAHQYEGRPVGRKAPFTPEEVRAIRVRLPMEKRARGLALFDLRVDSRRWGCDFFALRVRDLQHGGQLAPRAIVTERKTGPPVQFEFTSPKREAVQLVSGEHARNVPPGRTSGV